MLWCWMMGLGLGWESVRQKGRRLGLFASERWLLLFLCLLGSKMRTTERRLWGRYRRLCCPR